MLNRLAHPILRILTILLFIGIAYYLLFFAWHAWLWLASDYPIDYGEGPLLSQITLLRSGTPLWHLYNNPAEHPYAVVNYPPVYLLITTAVSSLTNAVLLAGRLVSLIATIGCVVAIALLAGNPSVQNRSQETQSSYQIPINRWLLALLFCTIPAVFEWAVVLRVDITGVCLGLWGLVALRRRWIKRAALLLLLSLCTKPSLVAAPMAASIWLALEAWQAIKQDNVSFSIKRLLHHSRSLLILVGVMGIVGGIVVALLQWASDGWFLLHVLVANANEWQSNLAWQFWREQALLRGALVLAAIVGVIWYLSKDVPKLQKEDDSGFSGKDNPVGAHCAAPLTRSHPIPLPLLYTLAAVLPAIGVGKVGAYANYFLELYAGLVWIVCAVLVGDMGSQKHPVAWGRLVAHASILVLLLGSLIPYQRIWSPTKLYKAGILEPNPLQLSTAIRHDIRREEQILSALGRVYDGLAAEVETATSPIFTDTPGVAAATGKVSQLQAFEHRQLFDQGVWDERPLLSNLANGDIDLAVVDYLGNWLTPGMVEIIRHRYAQDGSMGTFKLFRPVATGSYTPLEIVFPNGPKLNGYYLNNTTSYTTATHVFAGDVFIVTLAWEKWEALMPNASSSSRQQTSHTWDVVLTLQDEEENVLLETTYPLLYGVFPPEEWENNKEIQHMHPLVLPADLPSGNCQLLLTLRSNGETLSPPQQLATIAIQAITEHDRTKFGSTPRYFAETGYIVPSPFLEFWQQWGGIEWAGLPLMPAVPFDWGQLQCFEYVCLELPLETEGSIQQRPLGDTLYRAETIRGDGCIEGESLQTARQDNGLCPGFRHLWEQYGAEVIGPPISGELSRNGFLVQWTRYARLERSPTGEYEGLGRLGDDVQRLPPGMRYPWAPAPNP